MAEIISVDECKKEIAGYEPSRAGEFHTQSAKLADKKFEEALISHPDIQEVILLGGGSASGKTEYLHTFLENKSAIIFDSTLSTFEGARVKISKCQKNGKTVSVHYVFPDNLPRAYAAFMNRERKLEESVFYKTHSDSRSTILELARSYADLEIILVESNFRQKDAQYIKYKIYDRVDLDEFLVASQLNEDKIKQIIRESL